MPPMNTPEGLGIFDAACTQLHCPSLRMQAKQV